MKLFVKSPSSWFFIKISILVYWLPLIFYVLGGYEIITLPVSVWRWLPFVHNINATTVFFLKTAAVIIGLLWLFEKKMMIVAPLIGLLSTFILSIEESNGIYNRHMTISALFFAIALAYVVKYFRPESDVEKNRIQYAVQILAATYVLAGISKLRYAGISWIFGGKYMTLQILKSHYSNYFSSGNEKLINIGNEKADFVINHPSLIVFLLSFTLIVELCAWVMIMFPNRIKLYGLLLLSVHVGIYFMLDIRIPSIYYPMIVIIFNPLDWVYRNIEISIRFIRRTIKNVT